MGIFSSLTWLLPVHAINFGMKPNISLTIHEILVNGEPEYLSSPSLMVGKGHIRLVTPDDDIPPFTVKLSTFCEYKMYGVKHYKWIIYNQDSSNPFSSKTYDVGELVVYIENKSVAVWNITGYSDTIPSIRIVTDRR